MPSAMASDSRSPGRQVGLHAARLSSFQSERREWKMPKSPFWETVLEISC